MVKNTSSNIRKGEYRPATTTTPAAAAAPYVTLRVPP